MPTCIYLGGNETDERSFLSVIAVEKTLCCAIIASPGSLICSQKTETKLNLPDALPLATALQSNPYFMVSDNGHSLKMLKKNHVITSCCVTEKKSTRNHLRFIVHLNDTAVINKDLLKTRLNNDFIMMDSGLEYAATSIIVKDGGMLIERRNKLLNDPWAGQFALPGGHFKISDGYILKTAIRETEEETGVILHPETLLGHFGPFTPRNRVNLKVFAFVFYVSGDFKLVQSHETDFLDWVPISSLIQGREDKEDTTFRIAEGVIWGLTARMIDVFLRLSEYI